MSIIQILAIYNWFSSYSYEQYPTQFDYHTLVSLFKLLPPENEIPLEHKPSYEWMKDKVNEIIENNK